jgi:hypothetical protein
MRKKAYHKAFENEFEPNKSTSVKEHKPIKPRVRIDTIFNSSKHGRN